MFARLCSKVVLNPPDPFAQLLLRKECPLWHTVEARFRDINGTVGTLDSKLMGYLSVVLQEDLGMTEDKRTCFVIMPFSKTTETHDEEYWTKHFNEFLKPLIEEIPGVEAVRSQPLRGDILREIITRLVTAPVVIADITDGKPNVYWELGVRQSFKHGTVTIREGETPIPFDIGAKGTLSYTNDKIQQGDFSRKFKAAIIDCLEHPEKSDSHVLEAISGRGSLFEIFRKDETIRRLDGLESELNWNLILLKTVQEMAARNLTKKRAQEKGMSTARMRNSSIELLVTNRYIEERTDFYLRAELCLDSVTKMNESLADWLSHIDYYDRWISQNAPGMTETITRFGKMAAHARERILRLR